MGFKIQRLGIFSLNKSAWKEFFLIVLENRMFVGKLVNTGQFPTRQKSLFIINLMVTKRLLIRFLSQNEKG